MVDTTINGNGRFLRKRQSGSGFVGGTGQAVNSCFSAVVYNLVNGQLFANTSTSATQFGTSPGVQYANFTPSANPGSLTTVFSVDSQNNLLWGNTAFYNNAARFCVLSDGTIVAVFIDPTQAPVGCLFVALSMTRVSSCAGAANGNFITGPSGPSGAVGATGISGIPGASGGQYSFLQVVYVRWLTKDHSCWCPRATRSLWGNRSSRTGWSNGSERFTWCFRTARDQWR